MSRIHGIETTEDGLRAYELIAGNRWYLVALCFEKENCEAYTKKIAQRNKAIDYTIEPVTVGGSSKRSWRGLIRLN